MPESVVFSLRFPPDLLARLDSAAQQAGISRNEHIRRLCENSNGLGSRHDPTHPPITGAKRPEWDPGDCAHPIGRRVAGICMICGKRVQKAVVRS